MNVPDTHSSEAPPLGAAGEAEAARKARDTQITQPSHDDEGLIERLRAEAQLKIVCPYDKRSPDYWTTPDAPAPCPLCGATEDDDSKCRGAHTSVMEEAANTISRLKGERDALNSIATETYARLREERDEARGWCRWLVAQAADETLTLKERVGIVAYFPADEYPAHPAEARSLQLEEEVKELREGLEPFAEAGAQVPPRVSDGATCAYYRDTTFSAAHLRKARSLLSPSQDVGLSSARSSRDARSST